MDIAGYARRAAQCARRHDLKIAASFPTDHHLHAGAPGGTVLAPEAADAIRSADVILSLDWLDVAGTFKAVGNVTAKVIQVSVDHRLHNGWSMDYQGLPPVDVFIDCEPDVAVPALLATLGSGFSPRCGHAREGIPDAGRRQAHGRSPCRGAAQGRRREADQPHPRLAVVERRELGIQSSPRLSRL